MSALRRDNTDKDFCNIPMAIEWYKKVEGDNRAHAFYNIGRIYHNGKGIDRVYNQALHFSKNSAKLKNNNALYSLGEIFCYGQGVHQDFQASYCYFKEAAHNSFTFAQERLAKMHLYGEGVGQDNNQALEYYKKAAKNDYGEALKRVYKSCAFRGISLLFEHGDGIDRDYEISVAGYIESPNLGNKGGYYNLSLIYFFFLEKAFVEITKSVLIN